MPIDYSYFRFWNRITRAGAKPLTREQAQAMHLKEQSYAVGVTENGRPVAFIEVASGFHGVSFLDELGREELRYSFKRIAAGRLFMCEAITREFVGATDQVESGEVFWFEPSGQIRVEQLLANGSREAMETTNADVSANYEVEPEFGDYARLLVRERGST